VADTAKLVNLYALLKPDADPVVAEDHRERRPGVPGDHRNLSPNKSLRDIPDVLSDGSLRDFSTACREELRSRRIS
jgi:hypothetical protein